MVVIHLFKDGKRIGLIGFEQAPLQQFSDHLGVGFGIGSKPQRRSGIALSVPRLIRPLTYPSHRALSA